MRFDQHTLDNGLEILGEYNPSAQSVALGFFVRTGSRDETPDVAGVSHFLEHMLFKGTSRRSALEINREFDEIGALNNAFTSEENTVYFGNVLPEFQARLLDLLADMMRPALPPEELETERGVILQEIAMYEDMPHFTVLDLARAHHYADHPLGHNVLGTTSSIGHLRRERMLEYFQQRYAPNNLKLVLTGRYEWPAAIAQAQELCGGWEPAEVGRELLPPTPRSSLTLRPEETAQVHLSWACPGVAAQDGRRQVAQLIGQALGAPQGSRLYWALVDPGVAQVAQMSHEEEDGAGAFFGYASCDPERVQEVLDTVQKVLATATAEGLQEEELERAKRKLASGNVLQGEVPMGRLLSVGFDWVYRRTYRTVDEYVDGLMAVTLDDVRAFLETRPFETFTAVVLGPVKATLQATGSARP
jgi:predicted Zn-dependent peptidase